MKKGSAGKKCLNEEVIIKTEHEKNLFLEKFKNGKDVSISLIEFF